jgi:hypothetical protein
MQCTGCRNRAAAAAMADRAAEEERLRRLEQQAQEVREERERCQEERSSVILHTKRTKQDSHIPVISRHHMFFRVLFCCLSCLLQRAPPSRFRRG